jgi:hypothetical protein
MNKFFILIFFLSVSLDAKTEECFLIYDGLNPFKQSGPFIESAFIKEKQDTKIQKITLQTQKINSQGINTYINSALAGQELNSITVGGKDYNLLDIAFIKGAKDIMIERLFQIGFNISSHAIPFILKKHGYKKTIDIIDRMSIDGLEYTTIDDKFNKYSLVNYFIFLKEFQAISYLESQYGFDVNSNIELGDIVSINGFSIEERLKIFFIIDIVNYNQLYKKHLTKRNKNFLEKEVFDEEYNIYRLKHNCDYLKDVSQLNVKYAVKKSVIDNLINELDIDLDKAQKVEIQNKVSHPIIQEYLNKVIDLRVGKDLSPKSKYIKSLSTLTKHEIDLSLANEDYFYIDSTGFSLKEYLFLDGKYEWEANSIEMSMNRLAHFLIKEKINFSNKKYISLLNKIKLINENGKNLSYFLLSHAKSNETIRLVHKILPEPTAMYGLNPLEMLQIKLELYPELNDSIKFISKTLKESFRNRL